MKKIQKGLMILAMFLMMVAPMFVLTVAAANVDPWGGQQNNIDTEIGLGNEDPRVMIAKIINFAMGFLGIIAVVLILAAGFKWMTAGGDEAKVEEAKKLMSAAVIGLVIILAAWGIATMVMAQLLTATGAN